jgi:predicted SnoaL-like aldol condensation-catalyzing enzyme
MKRTHIPQPGQRRRALLRHAMIGCSALVAAELLASAAQAAEPDRSRTCDVRAIADDFVNLFYRQKKVREAFNRYVAAGYIQHSPIGANGRDNAIAFLEPRMTGNKDLVIDVKRVLVDGNLIAIHTYTRANVSDPGLAVVDMFRVEDCKIAEHWDVVQPVPQSMPNGRSMF